VTVKARPPEVHSLASPSPASSSVTVKTTREEQLEDKQRQEEQRQEELFQEARRSKEDSRLSLDRAA
jgi:hypothetical protein